MNAHTLVNDLGAGNYAFVQAGGSWGWSNTGLITSEGESLLVDTLFDLTNTEIMLEQFRQTTSAANNIHTIVNTHHDGDHVNGNQLLPGAQIFASQAAADRMANRHAHKGVTQLMGEADVQGNLREFLNDNFGEFDFSGIDLALPTETFVGEKTTYVGSKRVELVQVGPAHTPGDVLVHVPENSTVFAGDILFNGSHPIIWAGPPSRWVQACDLILEWDPEHVVAGHGPLSGAEAVVAQRDYLRTLIEFGEEAYKRGLTSEEAAAEAMKTRLWSGWGEWERLIVNFAAVYSEFGQAQPYSTHLEAFAAMADFRAGFKELERI